VSDNTRIEWADATVNAVNGCSVHSPGCTNCYAMKLAGTRLRHHPSRAGLTAPSKAGPVWTGEVRLNEQALLQPLKWKRPRRIFWNAHGDLFHKNVPDEWIDRVFAVAALTPQHTHMILTKRSERMREYMADITAVGPGMGNVNRIAMAAEQFDGEGLIPAILRSRWPLPNVWLGVSVEDQARADDRIPDLLATPAAVRFLSCEPLLGPVNLETAWHGENALAGECWGDCNWCKKGPDFPPMHNCQAGLQSEAHWMKGRDGIDWVIAGGESGPGARPMHPAWARSLRDQCADAGVPFFFKQWGEWAPELEEGCGIHPDACYREDGSPRFAGAAIRLDGTRAPTAEDGTAFLRNCGKKRAGRMLDGREHSEFPT